MIKRFFIFVVIISFINVISTAHTLKNKPCIRLQPTFIGKLIILPSAGQFYVMETIPEYLKNQLNRSLTNIIGERWRDIEGYEGFYKISSLARVKRMARIVPSKSKRTPNLLLNKKPRIHNYHINKGGRPRVQLSRDGINKIFSLSRLVAIAFVPNPNNLPLVCHKDDEPLNNMYKNLFWGTQQDNIDDKCNKGRQARGEKNYKAVFCASQILEIRNKFISGNYTKSELATEYNTTGTNIGYIVTRKNWKHI